MSIIVGMGTVQLHQAVLNGLAYGMHESSGRPCSLGGAPSHPRKAEAVFFEWVETTYPPAPPAFFGLQKPSKTSNDFQRLSKAFKDLQRPSKTP